MKPHCLILTSLLLFTSLFIWAGCSQKEGRPVRVVLSACDSLGTEYRVYSVGGIPFEDTLRFAPDSLEAEFRVSDSVLALGFRPLMGGEEFRARVPRKGSLQIHLDPTYPLLCYVQEPTRSLYPRFAREEEGLIKRHEEAQAAGDGALMAPLRDSLLCAMAAFTAQHYRKDDPEAFSWLNGFLTGEAEWSAFREQVSQASKGKVILNRADVAGAWLSAKSAQVPLPQDSIQAIGSKDTLYWTPRAYPQGYVVVLPPGYNPTHPKCKPLLPQGTADSITLIIPLDADAVPTNYLSALPAHTYLLQGNLFMRLQAATRWFHTAQAAPPAWGSYRYRAAQKQPEAVQWHPLPSLQTLLQESPQEPDPQEESVQPQEESAMVRI